MAFSLKVAVLGSDTIGLHLFLVAGKRTATSNNIEKNGTGFHGGQNIFRPNGVGSGQKAPEEAAVTVLFGFLLSWCGLSFIGE